MKIDRFPEDFYFQITKMKWIKCGSKMEPHQREKNSKQGIVLEFYKYYLSSLAINQIFYSF